MSKALTIRTINKTPTSARCAASDDPTCTELRAAPSLTDFLGMLVVNAPFVCYGSCGLLGGVVAYADPCSNHGMQDVGIAYDVPFCCKFFE